MELHDSLCDAWNPFQPDTVEWGDRGIDEPDVELDGLERKFIRRLLRDVAQYLLCNNDNGHHLQHVWTEQQCPLLLEHRGQK
jgi:hypothetical protein